MTSLRHSLAGKITPIIPTLRFVLGILMLVGLSIMAFVKPPVLGEWLFWIQIFAYLAAALSRRYVAAAWTMSALLVLMAMATLLAPVMGWALPLFVADRFRGFFVPLGIAWFLRHRTPVVVTAEIP